METGSHKWFGLSGLIGILLLIQSCDSDTERFSPDILTSDIEDHINRLADPAMGGRLAGSPHEAVVSNYIADYFMEIGLEPGGEDGTWIQLFVLGGPLAEAMGMDGFMSRNVIGYIQGSTFPYEFIVVGAHYDGQGDGGVVSLMETDQILVHQSADDNASGTSGLLELAHYFVQHPPERTLLFIAFSGEELGLLGSRYFIDHPTLPNGEIKAMVNLDMIGRMENNEITVNGTGTSDMWENLIRQANTGSFQISMNPAVSESSDHAAFQDVGIPAIHMFTGSHEDYHRPGDTPEKINFSGTEQIIKLVAETISRLDTLEVIHF